MNASAMQKITGTPMLAPEAARCFHTKWGIPETAYLESMQTSLRETGAVPQWYIVLDKGKMIAGAGVIENDYHDRKDPTPNICALYVEEPYRCRGIAGRLLDYICNDMADQGIRTLYLRTGHTAFYERYSWKFFCMVQGNGEPHLSRMYVHTM